MYFTVSIIFLAVVVIHSANASYFILYYLSAKDLPNTDPSNGPPDPYCVLKSANDDNPFSYDKETAYISNTNNPDWPERFEDSLWIQIERSTVKLKFEVWDDDWIGSDFLGSVTINLTDLIFINKNTTSTDFTYLEKPLKYGPKKGKLVIKSQIYLITTCEAHSEGKKSSRRGLFAPQNVVFSHCILVFLSFILLCITVTAVTLSLIVSCVNSLS